VLGVAFFDVRRASFLVRFEEKATSDDANARDRRTRGEATIIQSRNLQRPRARGGRARQKGSFELKARQQQGARQARSEERKGKEREEERRICRKRGGGMTSKDYQSLAIAIFVFAIILLPTFLFRTSKTRAGSLLGGSKKRD